MDAASQRDEPLLSSVLAAGDPRLAEAYRLSATSSTATCPQTIANSCVM
ncbi:hypothetical protein [Streptomyces collinus]